ncbi:MAG: leucine--tRNA ligase [Anaerolineaceae bacterium]|nr:leucine--tRNA ligase [Anaerolineaceae bacterium]
MMFDPTAIPMYKPEEIEPKWQSRWEQDKLYQPWRDPSKTKFYALTMLPYTSGDLHIGHWYAMAPSDARARFKRMQGYNVFFPIGFDAFGLPAENAAIKHHTHPKTWTYNNVDRMRKQLKTMGNSFDWRSEIVTADPKYYRWTQWWFEQFYKNNLAYQKLSPVDFCPSCNTTLAREQVKGEDRLCDRCGTPVIKKDLKQWFFRSADYSEQLLNYEGMDWPEMIRTLQTKWIGKSEGAAVIFLTEDKDPLEVFTTRPDTLWGVTFMVLSPEHPLVDKLSTPAQAELVHAYREQAKRQSDIQREATDREKTGVFTGSYAVNPASGQHIPIWIADYVLMTYGTGAIMAVPAHDQRDFDFARKFDLPIQIVIQPEGAEPVDSATMEYAVEAHGMMVNSGPLTGTPGAQSFEKAVEYAEANGFGHRSVNYRFHDWLISRQRYWGSPIPIVHCPKCGAVLVPEDQLPVVLPDDIEWTEKGDNPLVIHPTWKHTSCPQCGVPAERETDTMDTFMCSSWYHLRYLSPDYDAWPFDPEQAKFWVPVDTYTGGSEHANMHLIYTRFFHKAARDCGILTGSEPMLQLRNQGMVLGEDGEKMSKSRGNVVNPDDLVQKYGADTVRAYLIFFSRWEQGGPWSYTGIEGNARWLRRVWSMFLEPAETQADPKILKALRRKTHQTLRALTFDYENFEFNTIISGLMELLNEMARAKNGGAFGTPEWNECVDIYLRMLAPVCPHITEELWSRLGKPYSIHVQPWPKVDEEAARDEEITLIVQVNGKLRDRIMVSPEISQAEMQAKALSSEAVIAELSGREPKKVIVVPGKLVNIVV